MIASLGDGLAILLRCWPVLLTMSVIAAITVLAPWLFATVRLGTVSQSPLGFLAGSLVWNLPHLLYLLWVGFLAASVSGLYAKALPVPAMPHKERQPAQ